MLFFVFSVKPEHSRVLLGEDLLSKVPLSYKDLNSRTNSLSAAKLIGKSGVWSGSELVNYSLVDYELYSLAAGGENDDAING